MSKPKRESKPKELEPIHRKIKFLRERAGLSQEQLGKKIGENQPRIWKWEHGIGLPTPQDLLAFAQIFGVPLEFLCDDTAENPDAYQPPQIEIAPEWRSLIDIVQRLPFEEAMRRLISPHAGETPAPPMPPIYRSEPKIVPAGKLSPPRSVETRPTSPVAPPVSDPEPTPPKSRSLRVEADFAADEPPLKRGPGRPPRVRDPAEEATLPKRGPGRPPKAKDPED